jgi:hypothetical protein
MRKESTLLLSLIIFTMIHSIGQAASDDALLLRGGTQVIPVSDVCWVFAGGVREVPASFLLKNPNKTLVADLYLSGGQLGEPIAKGITFYAKPSTNISELRNGTFRLNIPESEKPLRMLLMIRSVGTGDSKGDQIGSIPLMVSPDTLLMRIGKRLRDETALGRALNLSIFGEMKGLRELLYANQVPFEDLGRDFPAKLSAGTVAVGELPKDQTIPAVTMDGGSSLMVFHEDLTATEDIALMSENHRTQIVIHHAAPINWADDPKAQKLLSDIIQKTPSTP